MDAFVNAGGRDESPWHLCGVFLKTSIVADGLIVNRMVIESWSFGGLIGVRMRAMFSQANRAFRSWGGCKGG